MLKGNLKMSFDQFQQVIHQKYPKNNTFNEMLSQQQTQESINSYLLLRPLHPEELPEDAPQNTCRVLLAADTKNGGERVMLKMAGRAAKGGEVARV